MSATGRGPKSQKKANKKIKTKIKSISSFSILREKMATLRVKKKIDT